MSKNRNPKKKKIVFIANTCWYIYNFRIRLLQDVSAKNYEVLVIAPKDSYTDKLKAFGYKVNNWELNRSSLNPLLELFSILNLIIFLKKNNPDLVHNFTIKPCIYGTIAAKFSGIKSVVNSVTGLGHLFINNSFLIRFIRLTLKPIYFFVFNSNGTKVIFQNRNDQTFLIKLGFLRDINNSVLIKGSGVDSEFFKPFDSSNSKFKNPFTILFPSRLILEKGIEEVLEAHISLLKRGENIQLLIAGKIDKGNRSAINQKYIKYILSQNNIKILGHKKDLRKVYSESDIILLPSWREGLSRSLIEAASMAKPIITTDTPGCKDIIDHGINGLLVPVKDSRAIELAILFLKRNNKIAKIFGQKIRSKVKKNFDVKIINEQTIKVYNDILLNKI